MLLNTLTPVLILLIGFLGGTLYASTTHESAPVSSPVTTPQNTDSVVDSARLTEQIDTLHQHNEQEAIKRIALEEKIAKLEKEVATLHASLSDLTSKTSALSQNITEEDISEDISNDRAAANNAFSFSQPTRENIEQSLLAYGFAPAEIAQLQEREHKQDLDQLYLRDRAIRENWLNSPRYTDELKKLTEASSIREELSDKRYDQYLYASGQFNRVVVEEIIPGSAAESVGLQTGDKIFSYDGNRIFDWNEVRSASTEGNAGETVSIEIERNGQRQALGIPRGPLGVRLNMDRVDPGL